MANTIIRRPNDRWGIERKAGHCSRTRGCRYLAKLHALSGRGPVSREIDASETRRTIQIIGACRALGSGGRRMAARVPALPVRSEIETAALAAWAPRARQRIAVLTAQADPRYGCRSVCI